MQKSLLQYVKIIFQSKVIPLFLPKCSKWRIFTSGSTIRKCILYGGILYTLLWYKLSESETAKKWLNEVDMDTKK